MDVISYKWVEIAHQVGTKQNFFDLMLLSYSDSLLLFGFVIMTALNEALTAEVQRLKITTAELNGDAAKFSQLSISPQMFQLHQQQQQQIHQMQQQNQQQQSQQQNGGATTKHDSNQ